MYNNHTFIYNYKYKQRCTEKEDPYCHRHKNISMKIFLVIACFTVPLVRKIRKHNKNKTK